MSEVFTHLVRRPRRLLGLFEEAWRRQRRRRGGLAVLLVLAAAAGVGAARLNATRAQPPDRLTVRSAAAPQLSSTALSPAGHFASLSRAGGHLLLAGAPGGAVDEPLNISGASTTLRHDRAAGTCTAAVIVPGTLRVGRLRRANCGDPALYGLHVLPVMFWMRRPLHGQNAIGIRIAIADPAARDGYRLGPIIARYEQCSDCGAQWIIGDGALWINVPLAHGNRRPGELLRISTRSGAVLARVSMPRLLRALLAVSHDGLWIAPSVETGVPSAHLTPLVRREYESLLHIAPGASRPRAIRQVGNDGVAWLAAAAQHVWLQTAPQGPRSRVLQITDASGRYLTRVGPWQHGGRDWNDEFGTGTVPYAASPTRGIDALISLTNHSQRIIRISPTTLTEHPVATIPRPDAEYQTAAGLNQGTSTYFLDPQLNGTSAAPPARLFRLSH